MFQIEPIYVHDPAEAAGSDSGDAEGDAVTLVQLLGTVLEQAD